MPTTSLTTTIVYRARFGVPNNGVPIWSESDFDTEAEANSFMAGAMYDGHISGYEIWKITTTVVSELIKSE